MWGLRYIFKQLFNARLCFTLQTIDATSWKWVNVDAWDQTNPLSQGHRACIIHSENLEGARSSNRPVWQIAAGPHQHSRNWFQAPSGPMTIVLCFPDFYVFWNGVSSTRGAVWLLLVTPGLLGGERESEREWSLSSTRCIKATINSTFLLSSKLLLVLASIVLGSELL
jgi:hypothetical protein